MTNTNPSSHNQVISIAKGIGITLMVVGHSGCPNYLHDFIYSFHMVLFYFLSGYFFREDKITKNSCGYIFKKIRGLYFPYVKWSVLFILLHNFFFDIGFNDNFLTNREMWVNIKRSLRGLYQGEHFLGAYWFLISLLQVFLLFSAIIWLKNILKYNHFEKFAVGTLFLIGILSNEMGVDLSIKRELMVLPFYYLGFLGGNRKFVYTETFYKISFFVCFPILLVQAFYIQTAVGGNNYGPYYAYLLSSICGIVLVISISELLQNSTMGRLFDKLGKYTLHVMTFHFLGFKILSALIINTLGMPFVLIRKWPVPDELNSFWLLYSVFGLIFSVCLVFIGKKIKSLSHNFSIHNE